MDNEIMILTDHWKGIRQFNDIYFPDWKEREDIFYTNALAGEVGELCNLVKRLSSGGTRDYKITFEDIESEIADIYIYLVLFCQKCGLTEEDFQRIVSMKLGINIERMEGKSNAERE
jgi:NTP pyrophosphatase (non-canonical NTP hydrolase)